MKREAGKVAGFKDQVCSKRGIAAREMYLPRNCRARSK